MSSKSFDWSKYDNSSPEKEPTSFDWSKYEGKPQEPVTFKGSAQSYTSGLAGGAGGLVPDIAELLKPFSSVSDTASALNQIINLTGAKGTHDLTSDVQAQSTQNALERILQQSGQFGGMEGLIGAATGGPVGAGLGTVHGSASGALYGGLKELGLDDEISLAITALATVSPIAAEKLITKFSKNIKKPPSAPQAINEMIADRINFTPGQSAPGYNALGAQESDLIKRFTGENLPLSKYETAQKAIEEITGKPKDLEISPEGFGIEIKTLPTESSKSLDKSVEAVPGPGAAISPVEFETEAAGGRALNTTIRDQAATSRREVSAVYKEAEDNYQNINSIADQYLIEELTKEADKIRKSAIPNSAEATVLKKIEDLLDHYLTRNGMPVQSLIRTSDSVSGMANYELPFTGPKDVLKTVANSLDRAAIRAIENNGGNADLQRRANRMYGDWANRYANDDISPFLERTVNDPESLFKKSISNKGSFRAVESALHDSPRAQEFTNALSRKIAEEKMGEFSKDEIATPEYREALRNLSELIGQQRAMAYNNARRQAARVPTPKTEKIPNKGQAGPKLAHRITSVPKSVKIQEKIAKYKNMTPEQLQTKLKSRSGIKELKKELNEKSFNTLIKQEGRSILQESNIEKSFSGDDLYKVLNKENNFEIFTEILGREEALALKEAAKSIGKENMTADRITKSLGKSIAVAGKAVVGVKAYKMLSSLIL